MSDATSVVPPTAAAAPPPPAAVTPPVAAAAETKPAEAVKPVEASKPKSSALVEAKVEEPAKPAEAKPAEKVAELELKFADGAQLDEASLKAFKGVAGELGLDSPKAQKLVDLYGSMQSQAEQAKVAAYEKIDAGWQAELRADPVIGGEKLDASVAIARRALKRFGGEPLAELITATGIGNHPVLVRAFHAIGLAAADDSVAGTTGAASGQQANTQAALIASLFPSMNKE